MTITVRRGPFRGAMLLLALCAGACQIAEPVNSVDELRAPPEGSGVVIGSVLITSAPFGEAPPAVGHTRARDLEYWLLGSQGFGISTTYDEVAYFAMTMPAGSHRFTSLELGGRKIKGAGMYSVGLHDLHFCVVSGAVSYIGSLRFVVPSRLQAQDASLSPEEEKAGGILVDLEDRRQEVFAALADRLGGPLPPVQIRPVVEGEFRTDACAVPAEGEEEAARDGMRLALREDPAAD